LVVDEEAINGPGDALVGSALNACSDQFDMVYDLAGTVTCAARHEAPS
jgi:hypothetical protein